MAVWLPTNAGNYGWLNLLWICNVTNILVLIALWRENSLLLSAQTVGVLLIQIAWTIDFFCALFTGFHPFGGTQYMFDASLSLWMRGTSLFHLFMPVMLCWCVARVGYHRRGWMLETALVAVLLPITFLVTDPASNINWLWRPFGLEQTWFSTNAFLPVMMIAYPLVLFLPTHALLSKLIPNATQKI